MKPIQDLIYSPPKKIYWLFIGLALLLFIVNFLIFDISSVKGFLKLWAIPLVLSGFAYGYAMGTYDYKISNIELLKQTMIWLYLKLTGRFTNSVVLNSTIAFSYKTMPLFLIKKQFLSFKENISNQVTVPYFLLSMSTTLFYMLYQGKSDKILPFFQAKIMIIFFLVFLLSFGLFIKQGQATRRSYTTYQIKKFIKHNTASTGSTTLYSDQELLDWVKNTVSYAYQAKEQKVPKNMLFVTGENHEKINKILSYDYCEMTSGKGNIVYKIHEGKITRHTPNSDPREGGVYDIVTIDTIEQLLQHTGKNREIATISATNIEEAILILEKTSDIQIKIPVLHWQIYWADCRL